MYFTIYPEELVAMNVYLFLAEVRCPKVLVKASTQHLTCIYIPSHHALQELSGQAEPQTYTDVLRTLTYEHTDANPGNPRSDTRYFYINSQ